MNLENSIEENAQLKAERLRLLKDYIADMEDTFSMLAVILRAPDRNADALIAKARAVMSSQPSGERKPNWSNSQTSPLAVWKSRFYSSAENLEVADGVIACKDEELANLRLQLEACRKQLAALGVQA